MLLNNQRKHPVDVQELSGFLSVLSGEINEAANGRFDVALISDRRMKELNRFFRGKDTTTDVLSFPHEPDKFDNEEQAESDPRKFLGDIVISAEQAARQASENGLTLENEIKQLILHGLLHLCGYDHETDDGAMNKRELHLRRKLKI